MPCAPPAGRPMPRASTRGPPRGGRRGHEPARRRRHPRRRACAVAGAIGRRCRSARAEQPASPPATPRWRSPGASSTPRWRLQPGSAPVPDGRGRAPVRLSSCGDLLRSTMDDILRDAPGLARASATPPTDGAAARRRRAACRAARVAAAARQQARGARVAHRDRGDHRRRGLARARGQPLGRGAPALVRAAAGAHGAQPIAVRNELLQATRRVMGARGWRALSTGCTG